MNGPGCGPLKRYLQTQAAGLSSPAPAMYHEKDDYHQVVVKNSIIALGAL